MTVATMFIGLVPIMWSTGTGSDVMKRIAAPMIGGIVTSFLLELLVYPPLFQFWKWHTEVRWKREVRDAKTLENTVHQTSKFHRAAEGFRLPIHGQSYRSQNQSLLFVDLSLRRFYGRARRSNFRPFRNVVHFRLVATPLHNAGILIAGPNSRPTI